MGHVLCVYFATCAPCTLLSILVIQTEGFKEAGTSLYSAPVRVLVQDKVLSQ